MRAPDNRELHLQAVPLLLQRSEGKILLPPDDTALGPGDQLLFAGMEEARGSLRWTLREPTLLRMLCDPAVG